MPSEEVQEASLISQVLTTLGRPPRFQDIQVKHIIGKSYRINLIQETLRPGAVVESNTICDSFFVTVDVDGKIVESDPPIVQKYFRKLKP